MSIVKEKKISKEDFDRNLHYLGKPAEKLSLAYTLYGETYMKQKEREKERSALLQKLGDNVGAKDILYSSNDDLKVIRDGLKSKNNEKYVKDVVKLENFYDSKMSDFGGGELKKWMPYMEGKIKEQFKDFGYDTEDIKGYIFKKDSEPVKRIKKSDDFKDFVRFNVHNIVDDVKFSGRFKKPRHFPGNLFSAFGSVDFLVSGFDKDGNLKLYMFDTYDFNKNENSAIVEAGRLKMLDGTLKGFYTVHEILLSIEELDRIMEGK